MTLSLLFAACGPAPQDEGKEQKPAAVFENGSILIGSQRVELGAPADAWIAALGSNYRFADPELPIMMIWDELGIAAYTGPTKEHRVNSVSFVLRVPPNHLAVMNIQEKGFSHAELFRVKFRSWEHL